MHHPCHEKETVLIRHFGGQFSNNHFYPSHNYATMHNSTLPDAKQTALYKSVNCGVPSTLDIR